MIFEIEVRTKKDFVDPKGQHIVSDIIETGIKEELVVKTGKKYCFDGKNIAPIKLKKIATNLLANTLIQEYLIK